MISFRALKLMRFYYSTFADITSTTLQTVENASRSPKIQILSDRPDLSWFLVALALL